MNLKENLEWRYACKAMNGKSISDDKRNAIVDAMRMAPTSLGVQPVKFYLVRDPEVKKDLVPIFKNQAQIEMSDSIIIIVSKMEYSEDWLSHVVDNMSSIRHLPTDKVDAVKTGLENYMSPIPKDQFAVWAMKQAYICLGFGLVAAANEKVDSTPMEGFDTQALDQYLELGKHGYTSAVALVLGHRDEEHDYLVSLKKVRLPWDDMVHEI